MDANKITIPNKRDGLLQNYSPTGTKYGFKQVEYNNALYKIVVESTGGSLPEKLSGLYTSAKQAQTALTGYLVKMWEVSDSAAAKHKRAS